MGGKVVALPLPESDWQRLVDAWERALRRRVGNGRKDELGEDTVASYLDAVRRFSAFCQSSASGPRALSDVTGEHVEAYLSDCKSRARKANAGGQAVRHRTLRVFFNWLVSEGLLPVSPMAKLASPDTPDDPPPCLSEEEREALWTLLGRERRDVWAVRDNAIIKLFLDTPGRLEELSELALPDVDLRNNQVSVVGKGRRTRRMPFGWDAADALDRWFLHREKLLVRLRAMLGEYVVARHELDQRLWLGPKGALTKSGVAQLLRRRAKQARIERFSVHATRHTFVYRWPGNDRDLIRLCGWSPKNAQQMLDRYGRGKADERAIEEYRRWFGGGPR